ncbi:hypothetical protein EV424DRAFT_1301756, partial [Suillus variegatus]
TSKGGNSHDNRKHCGTCGNSSHPTEDCFGKGGVMEGKRDKVLARKCAAHDSKAPAGKSKPTAATGKPGGLRYDTNGRAYLLDSESHEAIYVATSPATSSADLPDTPVTSQEFAGLASDTITPAFIQELSDAGEDDYTTLLASIDTLTTSLDWRSNTRPVDFAVFTYKAPNQHKHTIVDLSLVPLFLDSGASVHISNDEADFFSLHPIAPRSVNGVGGLSIQAVGVGTLQLVV